MSDEEHHFESKADAGASKTFPQQAGTIRKNGYIVIKGRPCKVSLLRSEVSFGSLFRFLRLFEICIHSIAFPKLIKKNYILLENFFNPSRVVVSCHELVLNVERMMDKSLHL